MTNTIHNVRFPARWTGLLVAALLLCEAVPASAVETLFRYVPPEGTAPASVSLRGSMNGWGETPLQRGGDGVWSVTVDVPPGEIQYKYFIDGQWPSDMAVGASGAPLDPDAEDYADDGFGGRNAIRRVGGGAAQPAGDAQPAPPLVEGFARVHYHRPDGAYAGWGLHVWMDADETVDWTSPKPPKGQDAFGLYWDVKLRAGAAQVGFIVHKGDQKDPGPDMVLEIAKHGREVWLLSGATEIFTAAPDVSALPIGDLSRRKAHWLSRDVIAWPVAARAGDVVRLHVSPNASLVLDGDGLRGGEVIELVPAAEGLPAEPRSRFPHLASTKAWRLPPAAAARAPEFLKGQLAVGLFAADGSPRDATGLQIPGVLDDLFATDAPLGVRWAGGVPTLSVWAPTARSVRVLLFKASGDAEPWSSVGMTEGADGVWSAAGSADWKNLFYLYEVTVYVPETRAIEVNRVTDPYSRSLAADSRMSQIVDLDDPALMPPGWSDLAKPPFDGPEGTAVYELHVRDFSAMDAATPEPFRGTFMAFTVDSPGTRHLRGLAEAGMTHVHLLPAFDIATVNEVRAEQKSPGDLTSYPADSDRQQAAVEAVRGEDAYNWGYDPYHFGVPEGSYATDPEGSRRVVEFRAMVQALSGMGLRTVMDVVYNHTHASGQDPRSVFDRIVPGYYHRLNADGFVETSTCCQNTASEHAMMRRFLIDDVIHWARDYKVDGFRFDLMGHHMVADMTALRAALDGLAADAHGVDGRTVILYGEGWDFGEVGQGKRGRNATQGNLAGTGIGTFNDRLRDAVRGGSPFTDRREQGFATGLYLAPNGMSGRGEAEKRKLAEAADRIRIGMAGNLAGYRFTSHQGAETTGGAFSGTGYAADPQECVNYVSAHDNETLYDKIAYAAPPELGSAERARMQQTALSVVALSQGIAFFHAGSEMLRSKSMDADSYDSGDWFNRLDFTYAGNNFGVGLPPAHKNRDRWSLIGPLLARPNLKPGPAEIAATVEHLKTMLAVRRSTPLFRLRTAEDIQKRVRFHNTGPGQIPGLIVMSVQDSGEGEAVLDPNWSMVVALINAGPEEATFRHHGLIGRGLALHPALAASPDAPTRGSTFESDTGAFTVPPRTTAVFTLAR